MTDQKLLELDGEDVLAAANDHILEAAHDVDVTAFVHSCQVTGMQPAIAVNRLRGFLGHLVIALHNQETPAAELDALTAGNRLAGDGIENLDVGMGQRYADGRTLRL